MQTLLTLAIGAVFGAACSYYAKQRGRDATTWFFIGLFFGLIALILLFILPNKKAAEEAPAPIVEILTPKINTPTLFWYYLDAGNNQFGPMSFDALQAAAKDNKVTDQTYVWNEKMDNWKIFGEIPKIEEASP